MWQEIVSDKHGQQEEIVERALEIVGERQGCEDSRGQGQFAQEVFAQDRQAHELEGGHGGLGLRNERGALCRGGSGLSQAGLDCIGGGRAVLRLLLLEPLGAVATVAVVAALAAHATAHVDCGGSQISERFSDD